MPDDKKKDLSPADNSSESEMDMGDNGEGSDKNLSPEEAEALKKENASLKIALKQERENKKKKGLNVPENNQEDKPTEKDEKWFVENYNKNRANELVQEQVEYEEEAKQEILKRFPSLKDDNEFGIKKDVIEAYNDLLKGRVARGFVPKTKKSISELVIKAVIQTYPDLYLAEQKQKKEAGDDYEGTESGLGNLRVSEKPQTEKIPETLKGFDEFLKGSGYKETKK